MQQIDFVEGTRTSSVKRVMLVHQHGHLHVLLMQIGSFLSCFCFCLFVCLLVLLLFLLLIWFQTRGKITTRRKRKSRPLEQNENKIGPCWGR